MYGNLYQTTFKVRLPGEDFHDFVIDWRDRSRPYKQQVFSRLAEISEIPISCTLGFSWTVNHTSTELYNNTESKFPIRNYHNRMEFNREKVNYLMSDSQNFVLSPRMYCYNKSFYIHYCFVPERLADDKECTFYSCLYTDTRAYLNRLKAIITNDAFHSEIGNYLIEPRYLQLPAFPFQDEWFSIFRQFNIMQFYGKSCIVRHQYDQIGRAHV